MSTCEKQVEYSSFEHAGQKYKVGDGVYVPCGTHKLPVKLSKHASFKLSQQVMPDPNDEPTYPELYRKSEYIKGSNSDVPAPFQIGRCVCVCIGKFFDVYLYSLKGKLLRSLVGLVVEMRIFGLV